MRRMPLSLKIKLRSKNWCVWGGSIPPSHISLLSHLWRAYSLEQLVEQLILEQLVASVLTLRA